MREIEIDLPGSKSIAARALILDRVYGLGLRFENLPDCDDTAELRAALADFPAGRVYNLGAGGTSLRFFLALAASTEGFEGTIDCAGQLRRRPIRPLVDALRAAGAQIDSLGADDLPPYRVRGRRLRGRDICVEGSVSSQFASALMMVQPLWELPCAFDIKGCVSSPYIDMTRRMVAEFGEMSHKGIRGTTYRIEADWSAAAFFYEYLLVRRDCSIRFPELLPAGKSLQGDAACSRIFAEASASAPDLLFEHDMRDTPDLVPPLAVGLCLAGKPFRLTGVSTLRHKESDRIAALCDALRRLGYAVSGDDSRMEWLSERIERPEVPILLDSRGDHRIAMALAVAAMLLPERIEIRDQECVSKSFPDFFNQLKKLQEEI